MVQPERSREIHVTLTLLCKFKIVFFSVVPHPVWTLFHTASSADPQTPFANAELISYYSMSSRFETNALHLIHFTSFECLLVQPADCSQFIHFARY